MFRLERHRDVLKILAALDAGKLAECGFLFGGGTRLALDLDEYRESQDIDFLCSDASGYADLRLVARLQGYRGLFTERGFSGLSFPREIRTDQYGIRFPVQVGDRLIKVELIREGSVELASGTRPEWSPVDCLATHDCWAIKLLANSDRWPDRQFLSRDLIDLGAMRSRWGAVPASAWSKAKAAYKTAVRSDLKKALDAFDRDPEYRERCFRGLRIEDPRPILKGLDRLRAEI